MRYTFNTIKMIATVIGGEEEGYTAYVGNVISEGNTKEEAMLNLENALFDVVHVNQSSEKNNGKQDWLKLDEAAHIPSRDSVEERRFKRQIDLLKSGRFISNNVLCWQYSSGFFWFRLFGRGLKIKNIKKSQFLFSERQNRNKQIKVGRWIVSPLPKIKI